MKTKFFLYGLVLTLFVFVQPAYAYLDPGTGSYLFQIFIASLLGSTFFLKSAFQKIKDRFKSPPAKNPAADDSKQI